MPLIETLSAQGEIVTSAFSYFLRAFCCFIFFPLEFSPSGIATRFTLAGLFAAFFVNLLGPIAPTPELLVFDILVGLTAGFTILAPLWIAEMTGELSDLMRGMNMAAFYNYNWQSNSSAIALFFRSYIWVLMLVAGVFEKILTILSKSYQIFSGLTLTEKIDQIGVKSFDYVCEIMKLSFLIVLPLAVAYLIITIVFAFINKLYPQGSFFTEMFVIKMVAFLLLAYQAVAWVEETNWLV